MCISCITISAKKWKVCNLYNISIKYLNQLKWLGGITSIIIFNVITYITSCHKNSVHEPLQNL